MGTATMEGPLKISSTISTRVSSPSSGIYPKDLKTLIRRNRGTLMFIAALLPG